MRQPDRGQEYRRQLLLECMASGDAFGTIFAAEQGQIADPVLTLLEPVCEFGGSLLELLVRRGMFRQTDVDDALQTCREEGRRQYVPCALTREVVRIMMTGTDNLHLVKLLDDLVQGGPLLPAMIAAGNSITICGYDPDAVRKPRPADLERARRSLRARKHRK